MGDDIAVEGDTGVEVDTDVEVALATLNEQMLSSLATYDDLSLVVIKPSSIWFGSTRVDIWDKMCSKNSDKIHILFSPSL